MSTVGQAFRESFGLPAPVTPTGFHFTKSWHETGWKSLSEEIGAGYFMDGFLYLWGDAISDFDAVLSQWPFLWTEGTDYRTMGKNAYGSLLIVENEATDGMSARVGILSPLSVSYRRSEHRLFNNTIGNYLPLGKLPEFLDDSIYKAWLQESDDGLAVDEILAIKTPLSLGGKMEPANFQVESIFDYYRTTGEIYAKRFDDDQLP